MIPLRLTLKNFMSYRDPDLVDFAPLHTACLTGDNGAGKSALLTAMTWALWGETPAHAADEDLIAQGEAEMSVDFEFALGDQQYRVLRARSRPQTGVLLTVPIPAADELDRERHDAALTTALEQAAQAGITGAAVTPFVLERVGLATEGGSVPANLALAANNAAVAAEVAAALVGLAA